MGGAYIARGGDKECVHILVAYLGSLATRKVSKIKVDSCGLRAESGCMLLFKWTTYD
jgi:hypothetical protein